VVQKRIGISGAQGNVLDYILVESENHPVYQKEIEKEFGLRPPTATELLRTLEGKGLIVRVPEENDARYKRIVFQDKAAGIKDALRTEIEESEALLLRGISKEEKEIFLRVAQKMLENLDSD
jgi:lexA DNA binding domain